MSPKVLLQDSKFEQESTEEMFLGTEPLPKVLRFYVPPLEK
jgi:hypothetical protein